MPKSALYWCAFNPMLQFTKRTEYGLIALVYLAEHEGKFVSVREIGDRYPVPRRLLAEVLKDLGRAGVVDSQRGATGGYSLARPAAEIDLASVIEVLDSSPGLISCDSLASENPADLEESTCELTSLCRIRSPLIRLREDIWSLLRNTTLETLTREPLPLPGHATNGSSTDTNGSSQAR